MGDHLGTASAVHLLLLFCSVWGVFGDFCGVFGCFDQFGHLFRIFLHSLSGFGVILVCFRSIVGAFLSVLVVFGIFCGVFWCFWPGFGVFYTVLK